MKPFKYYGGHDEDAPLFISKTYDEIDLTPYLALLAISLVRNTDIQLHSKLVVMKMMVDLVIIDA